MNKALSVASKPATSIPDLKGNLRTPARAWLLKDEDPAPASQDENDHPTL
jgi:hypothetical protein